MYPRGMDPVAAVVLAAGRSRRMGVPKQGVLLAGRTLLHRALDTLEEAGAAPLVVVIAPGAAADGAAARGARVVTNPDPARGMLSSVLTGLSAARAAGAPWALVLPVDCPRTAPSTAALLMAAVRGTEAAAAVPEHAGRRGHPVLVGPAAFDEVHGAVARGDDRTLADVLAALGDGVRVVPVDDPAVLDNVNRPADLERLADAVEEAEST